MSWVKRNLYFVVSCAVAVLLLGAAGWYCFSEWQGNNAETDQVHQAIGELQTLTSKPITADGENIDVARGETKQAQELSGKLRKFMTPIPPVITSTSTNGIQDRELAFAVRDTIRQLRLAAAEYNVALDIPDFAFSFSAQRDKAVYAAPSRDQLVSQLGEVKAICGILFSNRITSLISLQRERTADDVNGTQPDYIEFISVTNNNLIVTPYQIAFRSFDGELGGVLAAFANQPHGIIVRSVEIEPADVDTSQTGVMNPGLGGGGGGGTPTAGVPGVKGGLAVVADEKRLKVTMLLSLVKLVSAPGR